jgi:hypothetical protein
MASGIGCADGATLATTHNCELVQADGRDQLSEISQRALEGEVIDVPVGKAAAALVVTKQGVMAHELRKPVPAIRILPFKIEVIQPVNGTHQRGTASPYGVGKPHTVAGGEGLDFLFGRRVSGWRRYDRLRDWRTGDLPDVGDKAITLPRYGLDELLAVRAVL